MKKIYYFDHAATTPVDEEVLKAMLPYFSEKFGNPGGLYGLGMEAKAAIGKAREKIAEFLGTENAEEIVFTDRKSTRLNSSH